MRPAWSMMIPPFEQGGSLPDWADVHADGRGARARLAPVEPGTANGRKITMGTRLGELVEDRQKLLVETSRHGAGRWARVVEVNAATRAPGSFAAAKRRAGGLWRAMRKPCPGRSILVEGNEWTAASKRAVFRPQARGGRAGRLPFVPEKSERGELEGKSGPSDGLPTTFGARGGREFPASSMSHDGAAVMWVCRRWADASTRPATDARCGVGSREAQGLRQSRRPRVTARLRSCSPGVCRRAGPDCLP